jgi:broad-specificity NMP kinase
MLIEITGVPGSGKSSIYNALENEINDIIFISNKKEGVFYELKLLIYYVFNFHFTNRYNILFKTIMESNNTLYHKINITRNLIKKISLYMFFKNRKGVFIFDEGVSHIPFNLFVDSSEKELNQFSVNQCFEIIPSPDFLFIIDVNVNRVTEKLINRGHSRMKLNDAMKTKNFISKSLYIKDQIIQYYKSNTKAYKIVKNEKEIISAVNQIIKKLKTLYV